MHMSMILENVAVLNA